MKKAYAAWEADTAELAKSMEEEFVPSRRTSEGAEMLNTFNLGVLASAEALAEDLLNEVFTIRTKDIEESIVFKKQQVEGLIRPIVLDRTREARLGCASLVLFRGVVSRFVHGIPEKPVAPLNKIALFLRC